MITYKQLNLNKHASALYFPTNVLDDLKAIDPYLHIIWHPYSVQWDDIINEYEGTLEDPRTIIHREFGETNMGFVYTKGDGSPVESNTWHIWREVQGIGWAHVIKLEDTHPNYVNKVLKILYNYKCFTQKYGFKSYNQLQKELQDEEREKMIKEQEQAALDWQDANNWLLRKAMDNFSRGEIKPTNPTKEIISSFSGQTHRTKLVRPISEKEGGLYTP